MRRREQRVPTSFDEFKVFECDCVSAEAVEQCFGFRGHCEIAPLVRKHADRADEDVDEMHGVNCICEMSRSTNLGRGQGQVP
jgi:hypothetical protein